MARTDKHERERLVRLAGVFMELMWGFGRSSFQTVTVRELAEHHDVSDRTMRETLDELVRAGLIRRDSTRGAGTDLYLDRDRLRGLTLEEFMEALAATHE